MKINEDIKEGLTLDEVKDFGIDTVENLYQRGKVSRPVIDAYLSLWNGGAFRFTNAVLVGDEIKNYPID